MSERSGSVSFEDFQRWRRPLERAFWPATYALSAVFNSIDSQLDHPHSRPCESWVWEFSSALLTLCLVPAVIALERRWPLRLQDRLRWLPLHLCASVPFSLIHVAGMIALRKLAYVMVGRFYDFGPWWLNFGYEFLKDVRTYFSIVITVALYGLWVRRWQGEASLLAEPDEGPPVEPVERPERFLVRKLGREFLIAAREIESIQASGNYVNLRVRGREYPLRATMAGIEERLDPSRFVRVHRSYVVNLDYLAEIEPLESGEARLRLRDGVDVPCSRRYRTQLRERFSGSALDSGV